MANTYIDSNQIPRTKAPGAGEFSEVLNNQLAGAKNVVATVHWLNRGDRLNAGAPNFHHLVYLMEGEATITSDAGGATTLRAGDLAHLPIGLKTSWHVPTYVKKMFVLRTPAPLEL